MSDLIHVNPLEYAAPATYLSLRDQMGGDWYLWIGEVGDPILSRQPPAGGFELASRRTFSWLRWKSASGTIWYLWPSTYGGLEFDQQRPSWGEGTGETWPVWWSPGKRQWAITVSDVPDLIITGDGLAQAATPHSVLACPRCSWVGHTDRSNARRDGDGNPLLGRCPRDGTPFYPEDDDAC